MGRLNILMKIDNTDGFNSEALNDMFEPNSNDIEDEVKCYKYATALDKNLKVFSVEVDLYKTLSPCNVAVFVTNCQKLEMLAEKEPNCDNEVSFGEKIFSFLNSHGVIRDMKIPVVILCISNHTDTFPDIKNEDRNELLETSNRFVHFVFANDNEESYKIAFRRIISIGILMSKTFDLKSFYEDSPEYVMEALRQHYQSSCGRENGKNIAHLIAKMDVAWAVNKLCNDFESLKCSNAIFQLFGEQNTYKIQTTKSMQNTGEQQTPLMIAAINSKKAVLAAFMNFYSSNIDMTVLRKCEHKYDMKQNCTEECNICLIKNLLHKVDSWNKNLTYYIVTADEKCLGAYGTVLQFEQDYHIRKNWVKEKVNKI